MVRTPWKALRPGQTPQKQKSAHFLQSQRNGREILASMSLKSWNKHALSPQKDSRRLVTSRFNSRSSKSQTKESFLSQTQSKVNLKAKTLGPTLSRKCFTNRMSRKFKPALLILRKMHKRTFPNTCRQLWTRKFSNLNKQSVTTLKKTRDFKPKNATTTHNLENWESISVTWMPRGKGFWKMSRRPRPLSLTK